MSDDFEVYADRLIVAGVCTTLAPAQAVERMQARTKRDWFVANNRQFAARLVGVEPDEFDKTGRRTKWGGPIWADDEDLTPPQPCPDKPGYTHYILKSGRA